MMQNRRTCGGHGRTCGTNRRTCGSHGRTCGKMGNFGVLVLSKKHVRKDFAARAGEVAARAGLTASRAAQAEKCCLLRLICLTLWDD